MSPSPTRRRSLLSALGALLGGLAAACGGEDERWNVLLVTLDTTRADALHAYGYPDPITPELDRLAAEGTRFEHAWSSAAVTPVAHASILTGLFNHEHGLRVMSAAGGYRLPRAKRSFFRTLREEGWTTGAVQSAFPVSSWFGLDQGFDHFDQLGDEMHGANWAITEDQRRSDDTTDRALAFLAECERPWALWIHYWDPHDSVILPPEEVWPAGPIDPSKGVEQAMAQLRALYAAEVSWVDRQIGRLRKALEERGELERTLIVVVADHGEGLGDHDWWFHRVLYEEQVRVPLIVRAPGEGPRVVRELVRSVDIAPTVLDYLGLPVPAELSGRSLRPLMRGEADEPRLAFADQVNGYDANAGMVDKRPQDVFLYAVTDGRWKLVWRPAAPEASELFDLRADPGERANLFAFDHPEARRLATELVRERPWVLHELAADDESSAAEQEGVRARLGNLGYASNELVDAQWRFLCLDAPQAPLAEPRPCADGSLPLPVLAR